MKRCILVEISASNVMNEMMVNGTLDDSAKTKMMIKITLKRVSARTMMIIDGGTHKTKNSILTHDSCTNKGLKEL